MLALSAMRVVTHAQSQAPTVAEAYNATSTVSSVVTGVSNECTATQTLPALTSASDDRTANALLIRMQTAHRCVLLLSVYSGAALFVYCAGASRQKACRHHLCANTRSTQTRAACNSVAHNY
jgi:hypothetical protein